MCSELLQLLLLLGLLLLLLTITFGFLNWPRFSKLLQSRPGPQNVSQRNTFRDCRLSFGNRSSTVWPHHSCPAVTSLATSSAAHTLQNCSVGAQAFEWSRTTIPHRRIPLGWWPSFRDTQSCMVVKCLKSPGAVRHLATVHSLQRLQKSGTVYMNLPLLYVMTHLLSVWSHGGASDF